MAAIIFPSESRRTDAVAERWISPGGQIRRVGFAEQHIFEPPDRCILLFCQPHPGAGPNRSESVFSPIKRQGVFVVAFPEHLFLFDSRHGLYRPVPGQNPAVAIDHQGGIGEKVDQIVEALF